MSDLEGIMKETATITLYRKKENEFIVSSTGLDWEGDQSVLFRVGEDYCISVEHINHTKGLRQLQLEVCQNKFIAETRLEIIKKQREEFDELMKKQREARVELSNRVRSHLEKVDERECSLKAWNAICDALGELE